MLGFGGCWTAATANHPHNPSNEHSRLLWACSGRRRHHDNPPTPHNPRNQARMLGFSGCWIAATANHPHNPSNECSHLLWASSGPQPIHSPLPPEIERECLILEVVGLQPAEQESTGSILLFLYLSNVLYIVFMYFMHTK